MIADFSFITDANERQMLEDAYQAIEASEAWQLMKGEPGDGGYMFTTNPAYERINKNLKYDGHSGSSYGWTMRQMQYIAQNSLDDYKAMRLARRRD